MKRTINSNFRVEFGDKYRSVFISKSFIDIECTNDEIWIYHEVRSRISKATIFMNSAIVDPKRKKL